MSVFLVFLLPLFLASPAAAACDRCIHPAKAAIFSDPHSLQNGSCGYQSLATGFNGGRLAAAAPALYKGGAGCGACFQMRCKNEELCSKEGTTVVVTDQNNDDNTTAFVLSSKAFAAMAIKGRGPELVRLGKTDVEYQRVECKYVKGKNLSLRVEESSRKPRYLATQVLYQGGQTEVVTIDVAEVGSSNWGYMSRKNGGAVWDTARVPSGPLQFRFVVTSGFDGKWYWAKSVLPANWKNGAIYDSGLQINDTAFLDCFPCEPTN